MNEPRHHTTPNPSPSTSAASPPTGIALDPHDPRHVRRVRAAIAGRSFAVLSTVSGAGFPHAAGVAYASVGSDLYISTMLSSRKARNIAANPRVAVVIPVRRVPVGPPFTIQFQATATVHALDDPLVVRLAADGALGAISGHGELEEPGGCIVRITPTGVVHTYGLGVPVLSVARDPLHHGPRQAAL